MDIKPIETRYKGYRFRSRLEARWAVFFDALGVKWEYEKEGYDLGEHGWYLPDFWLPESKSWVEIKPAEYEGNHIRGFAAFSSHLQNPLLLIKGAPGVNIDDFLSFQSFSVDVVAGYPHDRWLMPDCYQDHGFDFFYADEGLQKWLGTSIEKPVSDSIAKMIMKLDMENDEDRRILWKTYSDNLVRCGRNPILARLTDCSFAYDKQLVFKCGNHNLAFKSVTDALAKARSARFEHGETPNVNIRKSKRSTRPIWVTVDLGQKRS